MSVRVVDAGAGDVPMRRSTLTHAVTKAIKIYDQAPDQLRIICKWRYEDSERLEQWYGVVEAVHLDDDPDRDPSRLSGAYVTVRFTHKVGLNQSELPIREMLHEVVDFPYTDVSATSHVTPAPSGGLPRLVVYYRVLVLRDDREVRGLDIDKPAKVPTVYFRQVDGFERGLEDTCTLTRDIPTPSSSAVQSVADVEPYQALDDSDEVNEVERLEAELHVRQQQNQKALSALGESVNKLQHQVLAAPSSKSVSAIKSDITGIVRHVEELQRNMERTHSDMRSLHDDFKRFAHDQRRAMEQLSAHMQEQIDASEARFEQRLLARPTATQPHRQGSLGSTRSNEERPEPTFDCTVAETYPIERRRIHGPQFDIFISDAKPKHRDICRKVRDHLFEVWDTRRVAVQTAARVGRSDHVEEIKEEHLVKLQRWVTCFDSVTTAGKDNDYEKDKLQYMFNLTLENAIENPVEQDRAALMRAADVAYVERGALTRKSKKPDPKDKDKDKDKDKTATDKGGSSGNGTGGR